MGFIVGIGVGSPGKYVGPSDGARVGQAFLIGNAFSSMTLSTVESQWIQVYATYENAPFPIGKVYYN